VRGQFCKEPDYGHPLILKNGNLANKPARFLFFMKYIIM